MWLRVYGAATSAAAPALRVMLRRRAARGKELLPRIPERFGIDPSSRPPGPVLWMHAASMGEAVSVLGVLGALLAAAPGAHIVLTTNTVTSAGLLAERLPALGMAERVLHRFVPLDVPAWVARFLDHWQPSAAVFVESELWPNMLLTCRRRNVPAVLLNARLSQRSFRRWRKLPGVARTLLEGFAAIFAQSETDAARLRALSARSVKTWGNLKFAAADLPVDAVELGRLRRLLAGRPVWLAASIHPGEDSAIGDVHAAVSMRRPALLTIVVPRHPERGAAVSAALGGRRRSLGEDPPSGSGVWVADTMGELGLFYRLVPVVFVGGSLIAHGGQNPLEPARFGCAIAAGPHMFNFADPVAALTASGGLDRVADASRLATWVDAMLTDPAEAARRGAAAKRATQAASDLPQRIAREIARIALPPAAA